MPRYRWATPREWLDGKLSNGELGHGEVLACLIDLIDNDQIQDTFQDHMEDDGYFVDLETRERCSRCGKPIPPMPEDADEDESLCDLCNMEEGQE